MRRDRVRMIVWVGAIGALVAVTVASVKGLYPTQAALDQAAVAAKGNAAAIAFNGPAQGLRTVGGEVAFQHGATGLVVVALMSLLMIGRLTRGEEEAGRVEMLRSLPVGSQASTAAAVLTVAAMDVAVGVLIAIVLLGQRLPVTGSVVFAASFTLVGLVFVGVGLLAAQVTENTRVVYGMAGAVLGAAFVLRAIGDIGNGVASWFSPIGWAQKTRPFAGERWWPFLVLLVAIAALLTAAVAFAVRRDVGSGLVAPRRGPPSASPSLGRPVGLALRLQRGSLVGWSTGVLLAGVAYGSIANSIESFVHDNKALTDVLAKAGGASLTDSYLATSFGILALAGTGFAIQSALRLRSEETSMRAEALLATPVSRRQWAMSHLAMAFGGSVIVLVVAGLSVGLSDAAVTRDFGVVPQLLGAALAYVPAMWLMVAVAVALVGLAPRLVNATWAFLAVCFVIALLGELLDLPQWLMDVSPFEHVPQIPAADLTILPLAVLTAVAVSLTALGLVGLGARDIG